MKLLIPLALAAVAAADYKAGVARVVITPDRPIYLSGYASRNRPSEGKIHDLYAKAIAVEDAKGGRVVLVGMDLIGVPRSIADAVAARVQKQWGLERARLVLNSSHTHTGPLIQGNLEMWKLKPAEQQAVREYASWLTGQLVTVIGASLADLKPAQLSFGNGRATFGQNRRQRVNQIMRIGENPAGPSDNDVPVLRITAPGGQLRAVLFGYACHNTTLTGEFYHFSGDYAGFAQATVEKAHPGATAVFFALCGADQNPSPRGTLELAERHGAALAAEVGRVLDVKIQPVRGVLRTAFHLVDLPFAHHTRENFEARLGDSNPFKARHARLMLRTYDERRPIRKYAYPVQAVAFGSDLTLLAMGGEVVIDYVLRVKKEFGQRGIIVAGYSNDVMSYIPSRRILNEGGYEADDSMIYYGMPGRYSDDVEEIIFAAVHRTMKRVGKRPVSRH
jgi:hypothetical protein